jgi:hypothetical protein
MWGLITPRLAPPSNPNACSRCPARHPSAKLRATCNHANLTSWASAALDQLRLEEGDGLIVFLLATPSLLDMGGLELLQLG